MFLARLLLALSAVTFAGFGAWFLADPEGTARQVEIIAATPTARTDFRATYGGFNLGIGVLMAAALATRRLRDGLLLVAAATTGYAIGRAFGIAADQAPASLMYTLLAVEASGCALAMFALARLPGDNTGEVRS